MSRRCRFCDEPDEELHYCYPGERLKALERINAALLEQCRELAFVVRNLALIERDRHPHDQNWRKADEILHALEALEKC